MKFFNIGDNVPGQIKESCLTFLITRGKGKWMGKGGGSRKITEDFFFHIGCSYLELRKHNVFYELKYKSLLYYQ